MSGHFQILLIDENPSDAELVRGMLSELPGAAFQVNWAPSLMSGLDQLAEGIYDAVVLDPSLPDSDGLETLRTLHLHAPDAPVVLLTGVDNDALALAAVQGGAQDYLVKGKLDGESLARSLRHAIIRHATQALPRAGRERLSSRSFACVGVKGGVGTTSFACHLALELHAATGENVLLADLDPLGGSIGFLAGSQCSYSITDAAASLHRIDDDSWGGFVSKRIPGVDVVRSQDFPSPSDTELAASLRHLIRLLMSQYRWAVFDLGRCSPAAIEVSRAVPERLLVSGTDLVALRHAKSVLTWLREQSAVEPGQLVLNDLCRSELDAPEVGRVLGIPIACVTPYAGVDLTDAYSRSQFVEPRSAYRKAVARFARSLAGTSEQPVPARGIFGAAFLRALAHRV